MAKSTLLYKPQIDIPLGEDVNIFNGKKSRSKKELCPSKKKKMEGFLSSYTFSFLAKRKKKPSTILNEEAPSKKNKKETNTTPNAIDIKFF